MELANKKPSAEDLAELKHEVAEWQKAAFQDLDKFMLRTMNASKSKSAGSHTTKETQSTS